LLVSANGGESWTSHLLFESEGQIIQPNETAELVKDGILHMPFVSGPSGHPYPSIYILSLDISSDPTDPDSWTKSNVLSKVDGELPNFVAGWGINEPNVMELPDGSMQVWARVDPTSASQKQPWLAVFGWDGETLAKAGFRHWDGAYTKQQIRKDPVTGAWFCMRNSTPVNDTQDRRTLLVLDRSDDMVSWRRIAVMASTEAANYASAGYQYPSFRFVGDDIVAVIRAAQPGVAANYHDSNAILFARVPNFRSL
jgi:hypothetical protein